MFQERQTDNNQSKTEASQNPLMLMEKSNPPSVNQAVVLNMDGPWTTRAGATLTRPVNLESVLAEGFTNINRQEWGSIKEKEEKIRPGIRLYYLTNFQDLGVNGGNEFHRKRQELTWVETPEGLRVRWELEDISGEKNEVALKHGELMLIPPGIIHTLHIEIDPNIVPEIGRQQILENVRNVRVFIIANTEFDPDDPDTQDTFSREAFVKLQDEYRELHPDSPNPDRST